MKHILTLWICLLAIAFVPSAASARDGWKQGDLDVYGRVTRLSYESLGDNSWDVAFTARLTITRVVRGRPPARDLTVKYIAHTDLRHDRDFRFHLRQSESGVWLRCGIDGGKGYVC